MHPFTAAVLVFGLWFFFPSLKGRGDGISRPEYAWFVVCLILIAFITPVISITLTFFFQWLADPAHLDFWSWLVLVLLLTVIPAAVLVFGIREIVRLRAGKIPDRETIRTEGIYNSGRECAPWTPEACGSSFWSSASWPVPPAA